MKLNQWCLTIQQDTSIIPPMTSPVIDLVTRPDSPNVHWPLPTTTTTTAAPTTTTTTTTLPLPPQPQQGSSDSILIKRMGELKQHIADFVEENSSLETKIDRKIEESVKEVVISSVKHAMRAPLRARFKDLPTSDMKEILSSKAIKAQEETKKKSKQDFSTYSAGSPPSPPPPPPPPSGASGASGTTGASDSAQAPPPPPPSSSTHQGDQSTSTAAPSSSKTAASAEYSAWTTTDTRVKPSSTTIPDDLYMDDETTADEQAVSSDDETGHSRTWIWLFHHSDLSMPTNNWASALKSTYAPPQENSLLAQTGDMATFMDWYCKQQGISELTPKDLEGPAFEIVKVFHHDVIHLQFQMEECHKLLTDQVDDAILRYNVSKPLPLGGEPGHMNAAYYLDVGLGKLVPISSGLKKELRDTGTQLNLTKNSMEAIGSEYKHDYTSLDAPRAVSHSGDSTEVQMFMRFNEIHKFSDGTLQQIDEALDYREQGLHVRYPEKIRQDRIFQKLEGFVGGGFERWLTKTVTVNVPMILPEAGCGSTQGQFPIVSVEVLRNWVTTYAVRITGLIADIEDKYHGPPVYALSKLEMENSFLWQSNSPPQCAHLMFPTNPFYGRESENPHAHINSFKRITSTLRFRNVPNDVIKLMMFPYSLEGAAKTWMNATSSKTDERIDKLADQLSTLVKIVSKKVVTPTPPVQSAGGGKIALLVVVPILGY
ncbi:hypothetical protein Tco_1156891 [Tanacetum coccineum]